MNAFEAGHMLAELESIVNKYKDQDTPPDNEPLEGFTHYVASVIEQAIKESRERKEFYEKEVLPTTAYGEECVINMLLAIKEDIMSWDELTKAIFKDEEK